MGGCFLFRPNDSHLNLVPETGLEPARIAAYAPKAYVYTSFTTRAHSYYNILSQKHSSFVATDKAKCLLTLFFDDSPDPSTKKRGLTNLAFCKIIYTLSFPSN